MSKRHLQPLRNNCRQLALVVLGFVVCISLLEAKGLVIWAQRLEVGPVQQQVLRAMESLERGWSAVASPVTALRPQSLDFLAERGWSDLPSRNHESTDTETEATAESTVENGDLIVEPPASGAETGNGSEDFPQGQDTTTTVQGHEGDNPDDAKPGTTTTEEAQGAQESAPVPAREVVSNGLPVVLPDADGHLTPLPYVQPGSPRKIALAGDSMMAVGLGAQLQRELAAHKDNVVILRAYRSATGLGRPDVFDWQREYPTMAGSRKPDVVIVAIGANDTQNFEVNRRVLTIGSPEWREVYAQRLTAYLDMLTQDGAIVLWVKLPPMRPSRYNQNVNIVNEVAYSVVSQNPRAIWWDTNSRFVNEQGRFQEFAVLTEGGRPVRIRQADGIHLSDDGAKLLTADIMVWLNPNNPPVPEVPIQEVQEPADVTTTAAP